MNIRRSARATLPALCLLGSAPAFGQAEGEYPATLFCEPSAGAGSLRESLIVSVAGGRATYSFRSLAGSESGTGKLEGGRLTLNGSGRSGGSAYTSRYSGDVGGRGGTLTGTHVAGGRAIRACQFVLGDGRS